MNKTPLQYQQSEIGIGIVSIGMSRDSQHTNRQFVPEDLMCTDYIQAVFNTQTIALHPILMGNHTSSHVQYGYSIICIVSHINNVISHHYKVDQ